jgi:hypothetical protein
MESQTVFINGKQRQSYYIRGHWYVREGYDLPVEVLERYEQKCDLLGEDKSRIVEKLVTAFTEVDGWNNEYKQPPIFERRVGFHIKDAVHKTLRGMFPWRNVNEN